MRQIGLAAAGHVMERIDLSLPDREIGSRLGVEDVELLRRVVETARQRFGMRYREIADQCDIAEHSLRNFISRKSLRPDNAILGRLYRFAQTHPHFLQAGPDSEAGRHPPAEQVRTVLPVSEEDVAKVYDWYCGYYLGFRPVQGSRRILVSWLHIIRENLPLPRFTQFIRYPDPIDHTPLSYVIIGYVVTRNGRLYLTGHHDAELKHMILDEPLSRDFRFLQGLCLQTSADDGEPFATRLLCQYLGEEADRDPWMPKIGVFDRAEFESAFDNAQMIIRSFGDAPMLTVSDRH